VKPDVRSDFRKELFLKVENFDKGELNPDFKMCSYEREKIPTNSNR